MHAVLLDMHLQTEEVEMEELLKTTQEAKNFRDAHKITKS